MAFFGKKSKKNIPDDADVISVKDINSSDESEAKKTVTINKKIPFAIVESYKNIRTSIAFLISECGGNAITVTSANASEGKSTTSSNLAVAFSQLGKKVLLIDADLRRASLHRKFKIKNTDGLTNVLIGEKNVGECVKEINTNLFILTAGSIPPNPSELLGSQKFEEVMKYVCAVYDFVIVDTPPLNIVSDSILVAPHTSGAVLVVRDGYTPHYSIQKAIDVLRFSNVNILGAVMNGANPRNKNKYIYRKYSYSNYSSYGYYRSGYGNNNQIPFNNQPNNGFNNFNNFNNRNNNGNM